jgi:hypothetical protein
MTAQTIATVIAGTVAAAVSAIARLGLTPVYRCKTALIAAEALSGAMLALSGLGVLRETMRGVQQRPVALSVTHLAVETYFSPFASGDVIRISRTASAHMRAALRDRGALPAAAVLLRYPAAPPR